MNQVVEIKLLEEYNVWMKFKDGFSGKINLEPYLGKGFTKVLLEKKNFETINIESGGGVSFYNGYDFCPNFLRTLVEDKN